ncbi:MAG: hypothetical protein ACUX7D_09360 [Candidatus Methanodesulfokora washburnensis]|jgi:hypothetical protein
MKSDCPALGYPDMDDPSRLFDIPAYFVLSYIIVTGFSMHPTVDLENLQG